MSNFNSKLKTKLTKQNFEHPEKYTFKYTLDTTISVYNLDGIIDSNEMVEKIYWAKDNLGGVDMSKTPYEKDKDVIKTWHSGWEIHQQTNIFDTLVSTVREKILECIGGGELETDVVAVWAMINKVGDQIVRHKHFEHGYSAVYYALADENANPLMFDRYLSITPKTNMLICFPGYLYHHVPIIKHEQNRILMSFNFWCRG